MLPSNKPDYQKNYIKNHYINNKDYYKEKARERKLRVTVKVRAIVNRYKILKGCADCGYRKHPEALDFDHVVGDKKFNVSHAIARVTPWLKIKEEIRKCEVRCANCHRVATASRR